MSNSNNSGGKVKIGGGCGCLVLLFIMLFMGGCEESRTLEDGKEYRCIGLNTDPAEINPNVYYEWSVQNVIVGIAASSFVIPPVLVAMNQYKCPKRLEKK